MLGSPLVRARTCAITIAAAAAACFIPPAAAASASFYDPPDPLPAGAPGDVIRSERVVRTPFPGVRVQRILYRSTKATGGSTAVSGMVLTPSRSRRGAPLVGISPGFPGMADKCAPSRTIPTGTSVEDLLIAPLLERGYTVAVTDYQGLGTPGEHEYVVGASEAHAVLDVIRAARRLPGTKVAPDGPVAVSGYSQGGHGAMFTAELQPSYAPDVKLAGVAAGGLPGDFEALADFMDGAWFAPLLPSVAIAYDAAYPELDMDSLLTPRGRRVVDHIRRGCIVDILTGPGIFEKSASFTTRDLLKDPAWLARLRENRAGMRKPATPLFLYHSRADQGLPFAQALATRERYCALGTTVLWRELHFTEHALGFVSGVPHVVNWLDARLRGEPAPTNC
ncbi:MAG: hypothetical protein JHC95_19465 [Solirubrobacteraceae bacterium]|nr:hypothetical protein [Solirubrobacteraceae bacterium]